MGQRFTREALVPFQALRPADGPRGSLPAIQELGAAVNTDPIGRSEEMDRDYYSQSFGKIAAAVLVGYAGAAAVIAGVAGFVLNLPPRRLFIPYALFLSGGPVFAPLLYWARLSRARPKTFAIRGAIAMFVCVEAVVLATVFSAIWLGILSRTEALTEYLPFLVTAAGFVSYLGMRQRVAAINSSQSRHSGGSGHGRP